jgi:hypothetical protein
LYAGRRASVSILDDRWVFAKSFDDYVSDLGSGKPSTLTIGIPNENTKTLCLYCMERTPIDVSTSYSDGIPYEGTATYTVWGDSLDVPVSARRVISNGELVFNDLGVATITAGSSKGCLVINFTSTRAGWLRTSTEKIALTGASTVYVSIGEDLRPQCGIEIKFPEGQELYPRPIVIRDSWGSELFSFTQGGPGTWRSPPLFSEGTVRVESRGNYSWHSDEFGLEFGKWVLVEAEFAASCTVRFRVLGEDDTPRVPAVALSDASLSVDWTNPEKHKKVKCDGYIATADENGVVTFATLPSGRQALVVESLGYEALTFTYQAEPGEVLDLGDLRMRKYDDSEGRISVTISGTKSPAAYKCGVTTFNGLGGLKPKLFAESGECVHVGLPFRKYVVFVIRSGGGGVWQSTIDLSAGRPSASLTIDVSLPDSKGDVGD